MNNHPFHLVTLSPWPIIISFSIMNNFFLYVNWFSLNQMNLIMFLNLCNMFMCMFQWWRDITRESTFLGFHSINVYKLMRMGMILFIISEIFFFISFFWTFYHSSLSPNIEIGQYWPPKGIIAFNPFDIPLLNTIILISSGLTITWSHHSIYLKNFNESMKSLLITIFLGIYFTLLQAIEYYHAPFCIADSIYGSIFFMATGFHGLHVIIGTLFLLFIFLRLKNLHFSPTHHFGFEAAAWYWHFVDVVWLFLFISIYWWSY